MMAADPDQTGPVEEVGYFIYFTTPPCNGKTLDIDGAFEDSNGDNKPDLKSDAQSPYTKYDYNYSKVIVTGYRCYVYSNGTVKKTLTPIDVATKISSNIPLNAPILIKQMGTRYVDNVDGIENPNTAVVNINKYTTTKWIISNTF